MVCEVESPLQKVLKQGDYISIKCHNTPGITDSVTYDINLPYYGGGRHEEWLIWKDKLLRALDGQGISEGPQRYTFTESPLTDDAKATYTQAALVIGVLMVNEFNQVLAEMTKHTFSVYALREQKSFLHRYLVRSRSMKLRSFFSRLEELNAYLEELPPDTEAQKTSPLPADEIIDIIYHSMSTTWKDWTRLQLRKFYHQRNDWFLWDQGRKLRAKGRETEILFRF